MTAPTRAADLTAIPTTAKELILVQRAAVVQFLTARYKTPEFDAQRDAAAMFPLPASTRARVVSDGGGAEWRCTSDEGLQVRAIGFTTWIDPDPRLFINATVRELVSELLLNPTETVEDDA